MKGKLMYIPNYNTQNYNFEDENYKLKIFALLVRTNRSRFNKSTKGFTFKATQ